MANVEQAMSKIGTFRSAAMSDLSPLSGEERKSNLGVVRSVDDPTETFLEPRL